MNAAGGTTILAAGTLNLGTGGFAGSIVTPTIANGGQIAANFTDTLTLAADISGTGKPTKSGTGTLTLKGTNTYLGGTTINGGTLAIFQDANLGAASGALTFGGGTLQAQAGFSTARAITLNAGGGTIDTNGNAVTASGLIGGVGGLTKIGAGMLALSGNNTYSGGTVLQQGTLRLEHDSALGTGALTTLGSVVDYANGVTIANPIILNSNETSFRSSPAQRRSRVTFRRPAGRVRWRRSAPGHWCSRAPTATPGRRPSPPARSLPEATTRCRR